MLFNSIEFAIFIPITFILYWFMTNRNLKLQNLLLVVGGIGLSKTNEIKKRKWLLFLSIGINLGFLGFFKYFNFFAENYRVYKDRKYFLNSAYHLTENERDTRTISIYEHLMSLTKICDAANY